MSFTYSQIATELGVSVSTAHERVTRGMQAVPCEDVIEAKRLELAKLDNIERKLLVVLGREHVKIDHGQTIMELRTILDDAPVIHAAMALLKVQERRARLLGLDEPVRARIEVITEEMLDAEIRYYEAKFSENDRKAIEA